MERCSENIQSDDFEGNMEEHTPPSIINKAIL